SYHRARLQATTAGTGGMLAVGLAPAAAAELIAGDDRVDIAALKSPNPVSPPPRTPLAPRIVPAGPSNRLVRRISSR
uniref:hypothetical protein n=1 Tax=Nocardia cyriacigeorgica TaxID=135487 RepID=UPI002454930A